jgi:hypothetical protein
VARDSQNAGELGAETRASSYALRVIEYDDSLAPVAAHVILQRPDEYWSPWFANELA